MVEKSAEPKRVWDFERWHHATCRSYSRTECLGPINPEFAGHIALKKVGKLTISPIHAEVPDTELVIVRREREIRKDPRDHFMLYIVQAGSVGLAQADRTLVMAAGDMALYDQTKPFKLQFSGHTKGIIVTIPRIALRGRLSSPQALVAHRIHKTNKLGRVVHSMTNHLAGWCEQAESPETGRRVGESLIDMITITLEAELENKCGRSNGDPRLSRAKSFFLDNLGNSNTELGSVCEAVGITPRTLNRLFLADGTTPMRWLWRQRLQESKKWIEGRGSGSIADVALTCGFRDMSHFSRAFKREFGISPSKIPISKKVNPEI